MILAGTLVPNTTAYILPPPLTTNELLSRYSEIYNVSRETLVKIIACENPEGNPELQSRIIQKDGTREESYGLVQIHLPSHPTITKGQATDPEFSIRFLAQNLSIGNGNMWTCYRTLKRQGYI